MIEMRPCLESLSQRPMYQFDLTSASVQGLVMGRLCTHPLCKDEFCRRRIKANEDSQSKGSTTDSTRFCKFSGDAYLNKSDGSFTPKCDQVLPGLRFFLGFVLQNIRKSLHTSQRGCKGTRTLRCAILPIHAENNNQRWSTTVAEASSLA